MNKKKSIKKNKSKIYIGLCLVILALIVGLICFKNSYAIEDNNKKVNKVNNTSTSVKEDKRVLNEDEYNSLDTMGKLSYMAESDDRINRIIDDYTLYPDRLIEMFTRNSDMVEYMLDYPEKRGGVFADDIGDVSLDSVPLLLQYDKRWGYGIYGDNVMAINGCGPTVLSMIISYMTGRRDVTPYTIAKYSSDSGYYTTEGTSWALMTSGISKYGVIGKQIVVTKDNLYNELNNGHLIMTSMRPGDFTTLGHFILITGIKDDKFVVNDPNSRKRSDMLWEYDRIAPQIKGAWSFSKV